MDGGVVRAQRCGHRVDYRLRFLRGGSGIGADSELWEYVPQVLFLRNYSVASGDGVPALCRKRQGRSSNRMAPTQCLVEGIENLQLEFGIDDDGDMQPDRFETAPDATELGAAVAARIYLLVRSVHRVPGYVDDRSYTLGQTRVQPVSRVKSISGTSMVIE